MSRKIVYVHYRGISALYLLSVYAYGIFTKSAWSDDYSGLLDPESTGLHAIKDGRIIYGKFLAILFSNFDTISLLMIIRFTGFIGLLLLNDFILKTFLKIRPSIGTIAAIAIAFTLPSFQFSSHWASAWMLSWAGYLAVLGFHLQSYHSKLSKILGLILGVCSLLLYPLNSFFIFTYIYSLWLIQNCDFKTLFKNTVRGGIFLILCIGVSYFIASLYVNLSALEFNQRVSIVQPAAIPEKVIFFITRPFALTYRPFFIDSPSALGLLSTSVIFIGILIILLWLNCRGIRKTFIHFIIFNIFVLASILPLLLVLDNQIDLRFVASNTWLYMFVVVILLSNLKKLLKEHTHQFLSKSVSFIFFILLILGIVSVNINFVTLYKTPFIEKQKFITEQISGCSQFELNRQIVILKRSQPWEMRNIIGAYSQHTDLESEWVPVGAFYYIMIDAGYRPNKLPILSRGMTGKGSCYISLDDYPK